MKYNIILLFSLIVCVNVFSQGNENLFHFPMTNEDRFYVNKTLFKIYTTDISNSAFIEKFEKGKWNIVDSFDTQKYNRSVDVDKNGFPDIAVWWKLSYDIFLFNPKENTFVHSGEFSTVDLNDSFYYKVDAYTGKSFNEQKMQLINKELNLYYNYVPEKRGEFYSELFQLKNFKKYVVGTIYQFAYLDTTTNKYVPVNAEIRKHLKINEEKTVETVEQTGIHGFDYAEYWKQNWQKFVSK